MTDNSPQREQEVREAIRSRLQGVCAGWPAARFDRMVEDLARITLKYERLGSASPYDRDNADRLLADMRDALARSESRHRGEPT